MDKDKINNSFLNTGCVIWIVIFIILGLVILYKIFELNFDSIQDYWSWISIISICVIISFALIYSNKKIIKSKDVELTNKNSQLSKNEVEIKQLNETLNSINEKLRKRDTAILTLDNKIKQLTENINSKNIVLNNQNSHISELETERKKLLECIKLKDEFYNSMSTLSDVSVKYLTELVADFKFIQYDISAEYLQTKKRPALEEAKRILELKQESKLYHEQYKQMLYKYEVLCGLFPELSTYIEDFESIKQLNDFTTLDNLQNDYDRVRDYVSKEDYANLSIDDRNQKALDIYINRPNKTKWQIGRDYEMYIAYRYRSEGCNVIQFGIEKKLEDMGRDLIVFDKNKILIVQCKYWSETKLIHEKHIAQLYGSTVEYDLNNRISNGNIVVEPVFVTNINLSETAKRFAKTLKVTVHKIDLGVFPRIKCNVNNNEKIYHLPFDQQYDRTKIENKDEMYAFTVKEAVEAGFRRAFRFHRNNENL